MPYVCMHNKFYMFGCSTTTHYQVLVTTPDFLKTMYTVVMETEANRMGQGFMTQKNIIV